MEADERASLSIEPVQQSYNSPVRQQEPTYSGADKDVVIIVSSDDDDDQPPMTHDLAMLLREVPPSEHYYGNKAT